MPKIHFTKKRVVIACAAVALIGGFAYLIFGRPISFPANQTVEISSGESLNEVGKTLRSADVVPSSFLFNSLMIALHHEHGAVSGTYLFKDPASLYQVAERVARGDFGFPVERIFIPEGTRVSAIPDFVPKDYSYFIKDDFLRIAAGKEGYLFPDTYFLPTNMASIDLLNALTDNFAKKELLFAKDLASSTKSLSDIIKVASIVEEEAGTPTDRRLVAGIIWKRLKMGMPLQVDATLEYETGKNTFELTTADLKKDSPYNTYTRKGLPPTPISNPGLDAIMAAIHPTDSKYLYYLSDKHSVIHYAATFAQHIANKQKYLQ